MLITLWSKYGTESVAVSYVTQEQRKRLDPSIDRMIQVIRQAKMDQVDGEVNYAVTRLLRSLYSERYFEFNGVMGVLESVKQEFYRRWVGPYEDKKMSETSDIEKS